MQETIGMLDLKIAQMQRHLSLLDQQLILSHPYPDHYLALAQKRSQVDLQLHQIRQQRRELLWAERFVKKS